MALNPSRLSDVPDSPASGRGRALDAGGWWKPYGLLTAAATVLLFHGVTSVAFPLNGTLSCFGTFGCYAVAAAAAFRMSRGPGNVMRARWWLVSVGLVVGMVAETLPLYQDRFFPTDSAGAGLQDVALLLRGLPFLAAVCLTSRDMGWLFAALDAALVVLVGFLASFAMLFAGPGYSAISGDTAVFWITTANVVIALFASIRSIDGADAGEQDFFRLVAGFLWVLTFATGWINFYAARHPEMANGSPLHLICDVPALALTVVLAASAKKRAGKTDRVVEPTFLDTLCSMFIPACSLLLAASIVPSHLRLGLAGVALGFLFYGLRSTVVLKESLAIQHELLLANQTISNQAFSDALTGVPNRRSFDLTLEREWKRSQRSRQPLALLMVDVDHFKALNDKHGHLTGDTCLREIAEVLRSGLGREADFVARYGGEEFAILLLDTGLEGARIVAESLRRMVELHRCSQEGETVLSFTVSIGVASEVPMVQESSLTLVGAADKALYRAKRAGRNRVEVHAWRTDAVAAGAIG